MEADTAAVEWVKERDYHCDANVTVRQALGSTYAVEFQVTDAQASVTWMGHCLEEPTRDPSVVV